jgi:UBX domain-containing protein 6
LIAFIKFLNPVGANSCSLSTGYFSTTARLKEKPTEVQAALATVPENASLEILEKLLYNIAVSPKEAKYRRIKLSNPKIKASIAEVPEARKYLTLLGWELIAEEGVEFLILPEKKAITMAQVRDIQTAQQELSKKQKDLKRSASAASLPSNNSDQQRLREQIEADRLERAAAKAP